MPVFFTRLNGDVRKLMPTPFVTVSKEYQKAGDGEMLGCTYNITLTGTIVADKGSPKSNGNWITVDENEDLPTVLEKHKSVLTKIKAISNLFSSDNNGGLLEVDFFDPQVASDAGFSAHVEIESVDFSEGNNLVQQTGYTVGMKAYILYGPSGTGQTDDKEEFPYHIQSAEESWDISETDDQTLGMNVDKALVTPDSPIGISDVKKVYTITHSMSATGKPKWDTTVKYGRLEQVEGGEAWQQALLYIRNKIGTGSTPGSVAGGYATEQDFDNPIITDVIGIYGMNIPIGLGYQGFNYGRTQTIDKKGGSVSITETWILAATVAGVIETFDISISGASGSSSKESGTNTITLSGTIRGLARADYENLDTHYAETDVNDETKYANALAAFENRIGLMGNLAKITANVYLCDGCGIYFSSKPDSRQVGVNVQKGEITYSFTYSSKPQGEFGDGVQDSSVSINDTHPANVIAMTPVLGRIFGPVIQDVGAVTEYKRSLSLSLSMNIKAIGLNQLPGVISLEVKMKLLKPSNFDGYWHAFTGCLLYNGLTIQDQLKNVISAAIPNEPGIRAYRVDSAPTESWDVRTGKYSFNISWIYERFNSVHPAMSTGFVGGNE